LSSKHTVKRAQLENREPASQEHSVEVLIPQTSEESEKIHSFFELGEGDYLLWRLEIVRRVKSGKSQAQVARELGCSPDTVRNTLGFKVATT
jgi:DNA-binding NarL/FixJ family response regulator